MKKSLAKKLKTAAVISVLAAAVLVGWIIQKNEGDPFTIEPLPTEEAVADAAPTAEPQVLDNKININTADAELLCTLDGIGEAMAQRIIDYREEHGGFGVIEDIMNVSGIGQKKFDRIKDAICAE